MSLSRHHTLLPPADLSAELSELLELTRSKLGLSALAIADAEGLLIAGAGAIDDCENLSTLAVNNRPEEQVLPMSLADTELSLCMSDPLGPNADLQQLARDCERILAA